jgi:twitching motility protein PilT
MIPSQLQTGRDVGMQTLDQALLAAIQAREVDPEDAFNYAVDKRPFARYVPEGTAILRADVTQGL